MKTDNGSNNKPKPGLGFGETYPNFAKAKANFRKPSFASMSAAAYAEFQKRGGNPKGSNTQNVKTNSILMNKTLKSNMISLHLQKNHKETNLLMEI